ncbi:MAG: hypothetical protein R2867_33405 [Caldilineaceae bacterium]
MADALKEQGIPAIALAPVVMVTPWNRSSCPAKGGSASLFDGNALVGTTSA